MKSREEARQALGRMLEQLNPQIARVIDEQHAQGADPCGSAVLVFDVESPVMVEAGGAELFAPYPRVAGRYIVAGATADVAASLARMFADLSDGDQDAAEADVRRISSAGHTVVLAQTGMACGAYGSRRVALSPGGEA